VLFNKARSTFLERTGNRNHIVISGQINAQTNLFGGEIEQQEYIFDVTILHIKIQLFYVNYF